MGEPPPETGGDQDSLARPLPDEASTVLGGPGFVSAVVGVTLLEDVDGVRSLRRSWPSP